MNKSEVRERVSVDGHRISMDDFSWDEKTNTFSSPLDNLVLDFRGIDGITFKTGSRCTFDTSHSCTFKTGSRCTFDTSHSCTFKTGDDCTFNTGSRCTFKTGSCCTFKTGGGCTFNTGYDCTFDTGGDCTFDTGSYCTFKTGSRCTFDTSHSCTFKTGSRCTFNVWRSGYFAVNGDNADNVLVLRDGGDRKIIDFSDFSVGFYRFHVTEKEISKDFVDVKVVDNSIMVVDKSTPMNGFNIMETRYIEDYFKDDDKKQFVAERDGITAHGESVKEAMGDVLFKIDSQIDKSAHVERIKKQGFLTPNDYRLLSGACRFGTNKFLESVDGLDWESEVQLGELRSLVAGQYGSETVFELLGV